MVNILEKISFDDRDDLLAALLSAVAEHEARLSALEEAANGNG